MHSRQKSGATCPESQSGNPVPPNRNNLQGAEDIDIYDLLYQSVILNLPNKKVCGINCNGDKFLKEEDLSDPRLDVFKNIKIDEN